MINVFTGSRFHTLPTSTIVCSYTKFVLCTSKNEGLDGNIFLTQNQLKFEFLIILPVNFNQKEY